MKSKIRNLELRAICAKNRLLNNMGSAYISEILKILIAITLGVLVLGALTALLNSLFPEIGKKIFEAFGLNATTSSVTSA